MANAWVVLENVLSAEAHNNGPYNAELALNETLSYDDIDVIVCVRSFASYAKILMDSGLSIAVQPFLSAEDLRDVVQLAAEIEDLLLSRTVVDGGESSPSKAKRPIKSDEDANKKQRGDENTPPNVPRRRLFFATAAGDTGAAVSTGAGNAVLDTVQGVLRVFTGPFGRAKKELTVPSFTNGALGTDGFPTLQDLFSSARLGTVHAAGGEIPLYAFNDSFGAWILKYMAQFKKKKVLSTLNGVGTVTAFATLVSTFVTADNVNSTWNYMATRLRGAVPSDVVALRDTIQRCDASKIRDDMVAAYAPEFTRKTLSKRYEYSERKKYYSFAHDELQLYTPASTPTTPANDKALIEKLFAAGREDELEGFLPDILDKGKLQGRMVRAAQRIGQGQPAPTRQVLEAAALASAMNLGQSGCQALIQGGAPGLAGPILPTVEAAAAASVAAYSTAPLWGLAGLALGGLLATTYALHCVRVDVSEATLLHYCRYFAPANDVLNKAAEVRVGDNTGPNGRSFALDCAELQTALDAMPDASAYKERLIREFTKEKANTDALVATMTEAHDRDDEDDNSKSIMRKARVVLATSVDPIMEKLKTIRSKTALKNQRPQRLPSPPRQRPAASPARRRRDMNPTVNEIVDAHLARMLCAARVE